MKKKDIKTSVSKPFGIDIIENPAIPNGRVVIASGKRRYWWDLETHKITEIKMEASEMKKWLMLLGLVCMLSFSACAGWVSEMKHVQSSITGLNRTVTLYGNDGKIIRSWAGTITIEDQGGSCSFVLNGKTVKISGTWVVEEN